MPAGERRARQPGRGAVRRRRGASCSLLALARLLLARRRRRAAWPCVAGSPAPLGAARLRRPCSSHRVPPRSDTDRTARGRATRSCAGGSTTSPATRRSLPAPTTSSRPASCPTRARAAPAAEVVVEAGGRRGQHREVQRLRLGPGDLGGTVHRQRRPAARHAHGRPLSNHEVVLGGGAGTVDAAAGTAHVTWDGDVHGPLLLRHVVLHRLRPGARRRRRHGARDRDARRLRLLARRPDAVGAGPAGAGHARRPAGVRPGGDVDHGDAGLPGLVPAVVRRLPGTPRHGRRSGGPAAAAPTRPRCRCRSASTCRVPPTRPRRRRPRRPARRPRLSPAAPTKDADGDELGAGTAEADEVADAHEDKHGGRPTPTPTAAPTAAAARGRPVSTVGLPSRATTGRGRLLRARPGAGRARGCAGGVGRLVRRTDTGVRPALVARRRSPPRGGTISLVPTRPRPQHQTR